MRGELIAYRVCGQPKIAKPTVLKGLKPVVQFPVYGKKASVYLPDDGSVVVHFAELFCKYYATSDPNDIGLPTAALQKKYPDYPRKLLKGFIYSDGWGVAFRRNEGYVRFTGLRELFARPVWDWPHVPEVQGAVYKILEGLSLQDRGFYWLNGTCDQSATYQRVADDLVSWLASRAKKALDERNGRSECNGTRDV